MGKARTRALVWLAILLACCPCAFSLDPSLDISQYAHTAWKIRDGFSKGLIKSIAQTPDGYLWLGTEFGLLRFDGVRAVPWQPPADQHLPSNDIWSLLAARDGTLWIGTAKGLAGWKDGKLTQFPELDGQYVSKLVEDHVGAIWVGAIGIPSGRLCAIQKSSVQCHGEDGDLGHGVFGLYEDSKGNLWAGVRDGLWRWKPGPSHFSPMPGQLDAIRAFGEDNDGALLINTREGIRRFVDGRTEPYPLPGTAQFQAQKLLRDRDGGLWIGTHYRGLLHVHQGRTDVFGQSDGLSGNDVSSLFEDREGNIWVATLDGLDRFRGLAVTTFSVKQGLSNAVVASVLASRDGSVWLGTGGGGLNRWNNGQITKYDKREGKLNGLAPNSLFQDTRGRIWVSTTSGFGYVENNRFVPVSGVPGGSAVHSIAEDNAGNLWIANQDSGLFHLLPGNVVRQIPWGGLGRKDHATALAGDPFRGGLWLGFFNGGVAYFADGGVHASYSAAEGLGEGRVNDLRFDQNGTLWAATEGGLSRLKNGHVATLTSKDGLPCAAVHWVMEDDAHSLWLNMPCGLVRIARSELDAWAAAVDKGEYLKRTIQATVFDSSDGVRSHSDVGGYTPHVAKSADRKLWFTGLDGVSIIDPRHLPFNKLPPLVHIEQVTADRKTYWQNWSGDASSSPPKLPPLIRDLEIDYTALSLVVPEKVRFRVKLEGWDRDWKDAGNERKAFYSNLPPRNYRFRVIASNNSGVWNDTGASLDFAIAPAYYQTKWFRVLCAVAFLALLWGVYRLRVRQLRREEKKLRDVVETIPAIAWTALPDGWVDFSNHHWEEYTGLSLEKGAGSGWEVAVHPDDVKRHAEKWRASVASGKPFENEARYRRADGEYRWFLVRAVPLRDGGGKIRKWYGTKTDIEDRKRAEQLQADLTHASRVSTMGELVASLSHELAQPLTVTTANAKASLRWLQRDPPDLTEVRKGTERIVEAGTLASEIINRLRSLYKKSPPQRESLDVNEIVQEMVVMLRGEANRYAVSIRIDLATDVPKITADRVQLQQVLMNIILNGIEATKETGGVLTVKSQLGQDGQVLISISDTGIGLPAEKADQIFNAFFTTKPQGSGMGLAISRSIIESHRGRLWATPNDGRGATFHFTLPIATEELKVPAAET